MYQYYLEHHAKGGPGQIGRGKGTGLFADFQELGRVWTHPRALQLAALRRELRAVGDDSEDSMVDFIDDRETPTSDDESKVVCLDDSGDEKSSGKLHGLYHRYPYFTLVLASVTLINSL